MTAYERDQQALRDRARARLLDELARGLLPTAVRRGNMTERIWEHFRKLASELTGDEVLLEELQQVANSPNTAREDHSALCAHRYSQGWKYGEVEDEHAKTSPLLRPWAELADDQRRAIHRVRAVGRCAAGVLLTIAAEVITPEP